MFHRFIRNIELWLSAVGVFVVWAAGAFVSHDGGSNVWKVCAFTALVVSVLHGAIFWMVRRRQQRVRAQAIAEIREMMADRIKNQLAVIGMCAPMASDHEAFTIALDGINESVGEIERVVDTLSSESLGAWKRRYRMSRQSGALEMA